MLSRTNHFVYYFHLSCKSVKLETLQLQVSEIDGYRTLKRKKERNPTLWKKICYKGLSGMMQHKNKPTSRTSIFALFEKLFMCSTELTSRECIGLTVLDFN